MYVSAKTVLMYRALEDTVNTNDSQDNQSDMIALLVISNTYQMIFLTNEYMLQFLLPK